MWVGEEYQTRHVIRDVAMSGDCVWNYCGLGKSMIVQTVQFNELIEGRFHLLYHDLT